MPNAQIARILPYRFLPFSRIVRQSNIQNPTELTQNIYVFVAIVGAVPSLSRVCFLDLTFPRRTDPNNDL